MVQLISGLSFISYGQISQYAFLPITGGLPPALFGALWVFFGVVTLAASLCPSGKDKWGFQTGYLLFLLFGVDVFTASVMGDNPAGLMRGLYASSVYAAYVSLVLIISGMDGVSSLIRVLRETEKKGQGE
jgi:hypothetical protein